MGKLTTSNAAPALSLILGLGLAAFATAQSAANFDTGRVAPEAPAAEKPKADAKPAPAATTPSRYVGEPEMEAYVESLSSVFLMRGRSNDPFGHPQDPDAKPVIKSTNPNVAKRAAVQATPFADIVRLIVVNTIMPGEKRFLVGTRSFKQGDQIPISFRNKAIRAQVMEVTSRQITFRNVDSGETASRKLDILPVGMTPGHRGITAPGMAPDRANAPLELDSGEAETSYTR